MFLTEQISKKWEPIVEHPALPKIEDNYRKAVLTRVLENQETFLREAANETPNIQNHDPVLISLVRRTVPNIIAFDIAGVQPMTGPTGLIFALRALYGAPHAGNIPSPANNAANQVAGSAPDEAFYQKPRTDHSGQLPGVGFGTGHAEALGNGTTWSEMSFTIEKTTVTAQSRALRAEYTVELAQDLKAIHGLDAESELSNILSTEIMNEINREIIDTAYNAAKLSDPALEYDPATKVATGVFSAPGTWNVDVNSDGRWGAEKYKSLLVKINKEANAIAKDTRRGRGNFIICSSNVASALDITGKMVYAPELNSNLNVDDTGNLFAGMLSGRYKVFVDPYATEDYVTVGYKGTTAYDAGLFYCPYVPLQMVKTISPSTLAPVFGFKIRYAMAANPFTTLASNRNVYFRKFTITNL